MFEMYFLYLPADFLSVCVYSVWTPGTITLAKNSQVMEISPCDQPFS